MATGRDSDRPSVVGGECSPHRGAERPDTHEQAAGGGDKRDGRAGARQAEEPLDENLASLQSVEEAFAVDVPTKSKLIPKPCDPVMEADLVSELPVNSLCGECESRGNFRNLYGQPAFIMPKGAPPSKFIKPLRKLFPVRKWTLSDLIMTARECRFCSLVLKVVSINRAVKDLHCASAVCSMTVETFGYIHPNPHYDSYSMNLNKGSQTVYRLRFDLEVGGVKQNLSYSDGIQYSSCPAYSPCIQLSALNTLEGSKASMLLGRPIGRIQVDIILIKNWLYRCGADHSTCKPDCWSDCAPDLTLRLIDVKRRKVVEAPHNCRYMALSYVWGGVKQIQLKRETMARLTKDGGISNNTSKSIMDAIMFVEMIGEEYLWVDALCIIQDDLEDLQKQIANMDVVYSCAMLTLVSAAGSDANGGLPGVLPGSRLITQFTESIDGLNLITSQCPFSWAVGESLWETRGWTFQEKVLSTRLLIFTRHQIFYHCNESTWWEDTILGNNDSSIGLVIKEDLDKQRCYKPSLELSALERYHRLVESYFGRNLKYKGDALNAFAGLLKSVSAELGGTHIWGLPESVFSEAMVWAAKNHFPDQRNPGFPSWSWAGWKGHDFAAGADWIHETWDAKPISNWYRFDEHGGHIMIESFDSESREQHISNYGLNPSEDSEMGEFQYNKALMTPIIHLLCFWTSSAKLLISREVVELRDDWVWYTNSCEFYKVVTLKGNRIGNICLNKNWYMNRADSFEFIVISRAVNFPHGDALNVMLIEWQNGVAYRVQLPVRPFMEKTWFIEASPEWKFITLG